MTRFARSRSFISAMLCGSLAIVSTPVQAMGVPDMSLLAKVPEPTTYSLASCCLAAVAFYCWKRFRR